MAQMDKQVKKARAVSLELMAMKVLQELMAQKEKLVCQDLLVQKDQLVQLVN